MTRLTYFAAIVLFLIAADDAHVLPWRASTAPEPSVFAGQSVPVLPNFGQQSTAPPAQQTSTGAPTSNPSQPSSAGSSSAPGMPAKKKVALDPTKPLDPDARLELVRFLDGEFAKALQSLPTGRQGFTVKVGQEVDQHALSWSLMHHGAAFNPGDKVQITAVRFRNSEIIFDINGGGRQKSNWRQHLQIGMATDIPEVTTATNGPGGEPQQIGSTLILDFGKPVPEMTPDELKADLSGVLDFVKRSAAVQWIDTLPPEMQKAIAEKRPEMGMTHEMVVAAIGKPDRKVRETAPDGTETEDWIFGTPPAKTVFVTFVGDKVVRIQQFPK
jgi:hypothetical protein